MLDIKELRKDPQGTEKRLKNKVAEVDLSNLLAFDTKLRSLKTQVEELKAKQNNASMEVAKKKKAGEDVGSLLKDLTTLSNEITSKDMEVAGLQESVDRELAVLPNLYLPEVPVSPSKEDNKCIKTFGTKPTFSFAPKSHVELGEKLKLFDFERGVKIAGQRWPLYVGMGARLEWALLNYMLDVQRKNGFMQVMPPLLARPEIMYGSAQLPKFETQLYKTTDDLYLIPTSECAINGMHYDEVIEEESLPLKYCAYTPCFRKEGGAAGKKEQGLIRTHQFNKVEMFCITKPEESPRVYEEMMRSAEEILEGLGMHYKNMLLTTGDMSFAAAKTIDIEVWLPSQDRYYEVSSVSNCTDFQARRSNMKFRRGKEKPEFVHTLNGSGLATSRLMVALLENNQQEDGSVLVPKVLHKYLGEEITRLMA